MLRGSTHYCAIAPRVLSHHIVDFLESRPMETAPTSIEVLLRLDGSIYHMTPKKLKQKVFQRFSILLDVVNDQKKSIKI